MMELMSVGSVRIIRIDIINAFLKRISNLKDWKLPQRYLTFMGPQRWMGGAQSTDESILVVSSRSNSITIMFRWTSGIQSSKTMSSIWQSLSSKINIKSPCINLSCRPSQRSRESLRKYFQTKRLILLTVESKTWESNGRVVFIIRLLLWGTQRLMPQAKYLLIMSLSLPAPSSVKRGQEIRGEMTHHQSLFSKSTSKTHLIKEALIPRRLSLGNKQAPQSITGWTWRGKMSTLGLNLNTKTI